MNYEQWIGKRVTKGALSQNTQPKPFKSKLKMNTVKGLTTNPHINKLAFTFIEDDSIVNCEICKLADV